jgi:hypothetical protein
MDLTDKRVEAAVRSLPADGSEVPESVLKSAVRALLPHPRNQWDELTEPMGADVDVVLWAAYGSGEILRRYVGPGPYDWVVSRG